jgi:hypothetical protein
MIQDAFEDRRYIYQPLKILHVDYQNIPKHTLQQLTNKFRLHEEQFLHGESYQFLVENLQRLTIIPQKIISFGLGSMDIRSSNSFHQHAALFAIAKLLQANESNITCYCQDPGYTSANEELLTQFGAIILKSPMGFLEVDRTSLVISISPDVPVKQIVADSREFWLWPHCGTRYVRLMRK